MKKRILVSVLLLLVLSLNVSATGMVDDRNDERRENAWQTRNEAIKERLYKDYVPFKYVRCYSLEKAFPELNKKLATYETDNAKHKAYAKRYSNDPNSINRKAFAKVQQSWENDCKDYRIWKAEKTTLN